MAAFERDSVLPCHLWCIQTRGLWGICKNKIIKEGEDIEGGDGRGPTLKNMGALMLAAVSCCWGQNLKVAAQRRQALPQNEEQWRCTCAYPERSDLSSIVRHIKCAMRVYPPPLVLPNPKKTTKVLLRAH
jgi:hypothetical protein